MGKRKRLVIQRPSRDLELDAQISQFKERSKKARIENAPPEDTTDDKDDEQLRVQQLMATMSKLSYAQTAGDRRMVLRRYGYSEDWSYDDINSTEDFAVVRNNNSGKTVIAFRGTSVDNKHAARDLIEDVAITVGTNKETNRYKLTMVAVNRVLKKVDPSKNAVIFTGHSLGGRMASDMGRDLEIPSVVFNKGTGPTNVVSGLTGKLSGKGYDTIHYTTNDISKRQLDLLSGFSVWFGDNDKNVHTVAQKDGLGAHTIDNFLPDETVDSADITTESDQEDEGPMRSIFEVTSDFDEAEDDTKWTGRGLAVGITGTITGKTVIKKQFEEGGLFTDRSPVDVPDDGGDITDDVIPEPDEDGDIFEDADSIPSDYGDDGEAPEWGDDPYFNDSTAIQDDAIPAYADDGVGVGDVGGGVLEDSGAAITNISNRLQHAESAVTEARDALRSVSEFGPLGSAEHAASLMGVSGVKSKVMSLPVKAVEWLAARGGKTGAIATSLLKNGKTIGKALLVASATAQVFSVAAGAIDIAGIDSMRRDLKKWISDHPDSSFRYEMQERLSRTETAETRHSIEFGVNTVLGVGSFIPGPVGWVSMALGALAGGIEEIVNWHARVQERHDYLKKWYGSAETPDFDTYLKKRGAEKTLEWEHKIIGYKDDKNNPMNVYYMGMKDRILSDIKAGRAGVDDTRYATLQRFMDKAPIWAIENAFKDFDEKTHHRDHSDMTFMGWWNVVEAEKDYIIEHGGHTYTQEKDIKRLKEQLSIKQDEYDVARIRASDPRTDEQIATDSVDAANKRWRMAQQEQESIDAHNDAMTQALRPVHRQRIMKKKHATSFKMFDTGADDHPRDDTPSYSAHTQDGNNYKVVQGGDTAEVDKSYHAPPDSGHHRLHQPAHIVALPINHNRNNDRYQVFDDDDLSHVRSKDSSTVKGMKQAGNPEAHSAAESTTVPGSTDMHYTNGIGGQHLGGYDHMKQSNADGFPDWGPRHTEPGMTYDPMTHTQHGNQGGGPLSDIQVGDLRTYESIAHSVLNHEPLVTTAHQNFMHYIGKANTLY